MTFDVRLFRRAFLLYKDTQTDCTYCNASLTKSKEKKNVKRNLLCGATLRSYN